LLFQNRMHRAMFGAQGMNLFCRFRFIFLAF
jgi:hypothetical protein